MMRAGGFSILIVAMLLASPPVEAQPSAALEKAEALLLASEYQEARDLFDRALAEARSSARDSDIARALLGLAEISQRQGNAAAGRDGAIEAAAIAERLDNDRLRADALVRLALIEAAARNRDEAITGL
jgi:tetratricopeptide (TPR) repeat protein